MSATQRRPDATGTPPVARTRRRSRRPRPGAAAPGTSPSTVLRDARATAGPSSSGVGQPAPLSVRLGVGLATLIDADAGGVGGVSYLVFVAPALLISAAVMIAARSSPTR